MEYKVIGLMSGTSLDGVDIAYCIFQQKENKWEFKIEKAETIEYQEEWRKKLRNIENSTAFDFVKTNIEYGIFLGNLVKNFIEKNQINPKLIGSHGHTIFHQPDQQITCQIGDGAMISAISQLPVVCDFRKLDVALNGQGAPLVPIGDLLLFSDFPICLNIGGIANVSFDLNGIRIAFDICPANMVLNFLSEKKGELFDSNGKMAKNGNLDEELLTKLNSLDFYNKNEPKSLGKEWVFQKIIPILNDSQISIEDKLRTFSEHISFQIAKSLQKLEKSLNLLITGGGTYNSFLVQKIQEKTHHNVVIPSKEIIDYKEALIFAFLALLRKNNQINTLKSVTGAKKDSIED
eukprot:Anaeramoba_ignava/a6281_14.p1 GENE.a6281_14~~a6281_14.p1  ORF type:complete len:348 (-),score=133.49 a6281_14:50-1093(-)